MAGNLLEIQPVEPFPAFGAQAKVQVKAINVSDNTFHRIILAIKGTAPLAGGVGLEMLSPAGLLSSFYQSFSNCQLLELARVLHRLEKTDD
jgi:hypothetical protein